MDKSCSEEGEYLRKRPDENRARWVKSSISERLACRRCSSARPGRPQQEIEIEIGRVKQFPAPWEFSSKSEWYRWSSPLPPEDVSPKVCVQGRSAANFPIRG